MPDLITLGQFLDALPNLTTDQQADAPAAITAATVLLESAARRPLAMRSIDRVYRPGRTRKIYLDSWPVPVCRLRTDLVVGMTVSNTDTLTNQIATVQRTATTLVLYRCASGVESTSTLTLSSYATLQALADAVNGLGGGWTATTGTSTANLNLYPISSLNLDYETVGALNQSAELRLYYRDVARFALDTERGVIELTENRPQEFRYPDRAWGVGYGWSWSSASEPRHAGVRAVYKAGYAVETADVNAGYQTVPDDLQRIAILTAKAVLDATPNLNVNRESDGTISYGLAEAFGPLPDSILRRLGPYVSKRF